MEDAANANEGKRPIAGFERHVQTIVTSITLALLLWVGQSLVDLRDRLTRFEERVVNLQAQVQQGTDDRFRGTDWRREKERIDERFLEMGRRLDKVDADHSLMLKRADPEKRR